MAVSLPGHRFLFVFVPLVLLLSGCGGEDGGAMAGDGGASPDGVVTLGSPEASFPDDFGAIQTVLERADGRVLVADPLAGALYAVDMDAGTREQIGAEGQGPEEYMQPDAVWPLPNDSTLLVDLGNGRMISLSPDLDFGPTSPLSAGDPRTGLVIAIPEAVDDAGNVYSRSMGGAMGAEPPDSGAVLRVQRGTLAVDTVASFKLQERTITRSGSGANQNVSMSQVPLSAQDSWGIAPDGSVVIARSIDYHVEWIGPDGTRVAGPPVPWEPISIGTDEKQEWSRAQAETGGGIGVSVMINNGALSTSFSRGGGGRGDEDLDQYAWPDTKPPFYGSRILVDPSNRAWVRRHVDAGDPTTYDVFDRAGERVATYTLPFGSRVVGFGPSGLYVASIDDFDLNYLHRYAMPM